MQLFTNALLVSHECNSHHTNNDNDQHYSSNYYLNKNAMTCENTFFNNMHLSPCKETCDGG